MSRKKAKTVKRESRDRIRELTDENMRLHREIAFLKNELQREKRSTRQLLHRRNKVEAAFLRQAKDEGAFSQKEYFSYIRHSVKNASVFWIYAGIIDAVRRFTFVSTTIRILLLQECEIIASAAILEFIKHSPIECLLNILYGSVRKYSMIWEYIWSLSLVHGTEFPKP